MTDVEPLAATDYDAPLWLQALTYPAGVDRDLVDAAFPTGGVVHQGDLAVNQRGAGANMSVDIAPGLAVIGGTDIAGQGKYLGRLKNTVNVPIAAAPGAGLTRIDLVYAHIADATVIGGTTNAMTVETPAVGAAVSSNPVPPAVPATSIPLAQIAVAAGTAAITTALITDRRTKLNPAAPYAAPFLSAGEAGYTTDQYGNWSVALPAGAKLVGATAVGAQQDINLIMVLNLIGGPIGGPTVMFRAWYPGGTNPTNTAIGASWIAAWTL
jgi:hypothetical protein